MSRKSCSFWFWHEVLEEFWCFRLRILDEILMLLIEKHAPWKECKEWVSTLLIVVFLSRALRPLCWWLMPCSLERIQRAGVNIVDCCVSFSCFAAAVLCWRHIKCIWLQSWLRSELHLHSHLFSRIHLLSLSSCISRTLKALDPRGSEYGANIFRLTQILSHRGSTH